MIHQVVGAVGGEGHLMASGRFGGQQEAEGAADDVWRYRKSAHGVVLPAMAIQVWVANTSPDHGAADMPGSRDHGMPPSHSPSRSFLGWAAVLQSTKGAGGAARGPTAQRVTSIMPTGR